MSDPHLTNHPLWYNICMQNFYKYGLAHQTPNALTWWFDVLKNISRQPRRQATK